MNQLKQMQKEPKRISGKQNKAAKTLLGFVNGSIFSKEGVVGNLPFLLFLALVGLVYIANGYLAEGAVRGVSKTTNELKEMRSEYITMKSDLMYVSKQSQIAKEIEEKQIGVKESYVPPKKIVIAKK